jgi:hypothetical protein
MFTERKRRTWTRWKAARPGKGPVGVDAILIMVGLALVIYLASDTFDRHLAALLRTVTEPSIVRFLAVTLFLFGVGIAIAANRRIPIARSRRKGGNGLRLGQGPLEPARFEAWIDSIPAGTLSGELIVMACWFAQLTMQLGAGIFGLLLYLYAFLTSVTLAAVIRLHVDLPWIWLIVPGLFLFTRAVFGRVPRLQAVLYVVLRRWSDRTRYAYTRLSRSMFQKTDAPEPGHEPDSTPRDARPGRRRPLLFRDG